MSAISRRLKAVALLCASAMLAGNAHAFIGAFVYAKVKTESEIIAGLDEKTRNLIEGLPANLRAEATLYAELAKLFNERPPIVLGNTEATTRFREDVLAKYLRICEVRKSSGNKHQPVLSLEISEGEERKVEVVIYRGYEEYIHQYPKLQRYLAKTSLKIREV